MNTPEHGLLPRRCCDNPGTKFREVPDIVFAIMLVQVFRMSLVHGQGWTLEPGPCPRTSTSCSSASFKNDPELVTSSVRTSHFFSQKTLCYRALWECVHKSETGLFLSFSLPLFLCIKNPFSLPPSFSLSDQSDLTQTSDVTTKHIIKQGLLLLRAVISEHQLIPLSLSPFRIRCDVLGVI